MAHYVYVPMWCSTTKRTMAARFSVEPGVSQLTLTAIALHPASRAGASSDLRGTFGIASSYPGCAGCGGPQYVQCGSCTSLGCWSGSGPFSCASCGNHGPVDSYIEGIAVDARG